MAADVRATTPTNAAQLVVPNKREVIANIDNGCSLMAERLLGYVRDKSNFVDSLGIKLSHSLRIAKSRIDDMSGFLVYRMEAIFERIQGKLAIYETQLSLSNPNTILKKGYLIAINAKGELIRRSSDVAVGDELVLKLYKGSIETEVKNVKE
jgi:exodeoxyribonuclease VII large subunit